MDCRPRKPIRIMVYDGVLYCDFVCDGCCDVRRPSQVKICTSAKPPTLARQPRLLSELALPIRQLASAASGSVLIPRLLCKVEANSILIWPRNNFAFDPLDGLWPHFNPLPQYGPRYSNGA